MFCKLIKTVFNGVFLIFFFNKIKYKKVGIFQKKALYVNNKQNCFNMLFYKNNYFVKIFADMLICNTITKVKLNKLFFLIF